MTKFILIGLPGDPSLRLIDLEHGSVQTIEPQMVDQSIAKVRQTGATLVKGVDLAIAVDDRTDAVGRFFFNDEAAR